MTEEERRQVETQIGDLTNFYEETIKSLKGRINELEKPSVSGGSPKPKTASGSGRLSGRTV